MKVTLQNTATYWDEGVGFDFEKRINLIYGLNGVGKTILSNFIYKKANASQEDNKEDDDKYKDCKLEGVNANDIAVYNQEFVRENFYLYKKEEAEEQKEELSGIFSLSKENKYIELAIEKLEKRKNKCKEIKEKSEKNKGDVVETSKKEQKKIHEEVWEIKEEYGDRPQNKELAFCVNEYRHSKKELYDRIAGTKKRLDDFQMGIDQLKQSAKIFLNDNLSLQNTLELFESELSSHSLGEKENLHNIEKYSIFSEAIIGDEVNSMAKLIKKLNNSDWVKVGLDEYLPHDIKNNLQEPCPFCQKETIDQKFVDDITKYFSQDYQNKVNEIENIKTKYEEHSDNEFKKFTDENIRVIGALELDGKEKLPGLLANLENKLDKNKREIADKLREPSKKITLEDTRKEIKEVNDLVKKMNSQIQGHNEKIANRDETKNQITNDFWKLMRGKYDGNITEYQELEKKIAKKIRKRDAQITRLEKRIEDIDNKIARKSKGTLNTDVALKSINEGLHELGIDNFTIGKANEKDQDNKYKLVRKGQRPCTFVSLSEGEKTIISFLYFRALCHGTLKPEGKAPQIIVIDDPVSSLSINFVFHLSDWIKEHFNKKEYSKIIILTHSLYFFHELERKFKDEIKRFRLIKSEEHSEVLDMCKGEIKNEYESYWQILKDFKAGQTPRAYEVVMANTARNILEYFFTFMGKKSYLNEKIKKLNAEPFWRLVNRESHSDENNLLDYKDFITDNFFKDFEEIFVSAGYEDHYKKMMGGNSCQRGMNKHQSKPRKN